MSVPAQVSIGELRHAGYVGGVLREEFAALADAAEELHDIHEQDCGCDRPGNPAACIAGPEFRLLLWFDFKAEP